MISEIAGHSLPSWLHYNFENLNLGSGKIKLNCPPGVSDDL